MLVYSLYIQIQKCIPRRQQHMLLCTLRIIESLETAHCEPSLRTHTTASSTVLRRHYMRDEVVSGQEEADKHVSQ